MSSLGSASSFTGSIPELYDRHLGPTFFDPSAQDLSARVDAAGLPLLELASGTGRLTAPLVARVAPAPIVALDLNPAMQRVARQRVDGPVRLVTGNAMALPFPDRSFGQVVCQYGVMFFPDKVAAGKEVRRVLTPGGTFLFSTWASLEENPVSQIAHRVVGSFFAADPPMFLLVPFGYTEPAQIRSDMSAAGFATVSVEDVDLVAPAESAEYLAVGLIKGSPMAVAIKERGGTTSPDTIVETLAAELRRTYGSGPIVTPMRARVVRASS